MIIRPRTRAAKHATWAWIALIAVGWLALVALGHFAPGWPTWHGRFVP